MLAESESILLRALAAIRKSDAQFVLICGDLTKDGEYICHQRFADFLTELANAGKNVYVINGNHDIYNPSAFSYNGSKKIPIKNTSPRDFQRLYYGYGYEQAIAVDPNSLSYVVEPAPGLRIIAMDSCIYNKNSKFSVTNGALPPERLNWVKYQIQAPLPKATWLWE